ncbi:CcoQ/FixQ family Cbb3-type cytochrome c oxidase assembly chaperone [Sphingomonas changnyeongensis]|uniref:CcoQ/FixQ family Cbb3-type cytochrome c oxidase assembly chaperone n=1 Tax=Sphingomonas changnyeongensis TaxID=2698679 RepID=A0A7Z2S9V8_9SPHN|nr:cbb3-type cytochrome c oxidase subunit 3 [Sphingomonas changnyeongensis]QHL91184.1 CcoQ/FixQ family Cbb3-type cytochrome c oxidase assembly chaperone [Sphingomonas changnyeongensis]
MSYHLLRELADSFGLLFLVIVFVTAVIRAFRPGARPHHLNASLIPLSDEEPRHG